MRIEKALREKKNENERTIVFFFCFAFFACRDVRACKCSCVCLLAVMSSGSIFLCPGLLLNVNLLL